MRTFVYIDGFNLYYRLLRDRPAYKWLDPLTLCKLVLDPKNQIEKIRYFTARVSGRIDPEAPKRQQLYLDALATIPCLEIKYGSFLESEKYAGLVKSWIGECATTRCHFCLGPNVAATVLVAVSARALPLEVSALWHRYR